MHISRALVRLVTIDTDEIAIAVESEFVGKTLYCKCMLGHREVFATNWTIIYGSQYATMNQNGRMDIIEGVQDKEIVV